MEQKNRKYPRPAVTVDVVLFTVIRGHLKVLLIRRKNPPFRGRWAIPGGFVGPRESLEEAALRELKEETNVSGVYLEQLYTFGAPDRDPRTRVITVAYFSLICASLVKVRASDDARDARWFSVRRLPGLAFDHLEILRCALDRLKNKLGYSNIGFQLLPEKFTLTELQRVYEIILGRKIDKRNFRKKLTQLDILSVCSERRMAGVHRPARLYSFVQQKFSTRKGKGILFSF
jgi:ADP-ribose pyrophosphatase YjhB (NUDIX family)